MTEILLFHHALGQTPGFLEFADRWRGAGHTVHTPDLYEGATFESVEEGVAHAEGIGFGEIIRRGTAAAASLPERIVYAGVSLGVLPAQSLAQRRPGARGALLLESAVPPESFGGPWPAGVPAQLHAMADDELAEVPVMREVAGQIDAAELFLYPGGGHLFTDRGTKAYDEAATTLLLRRTLDFLDRVG
ncbi:Dienelactone hydrolase [Micromonospora narathiwatensis]|uniref:Dienelactone hydrolase n=2 Tax=Micromonospora narathiwatensis TaxID=299146 RepID=A0A1A9A1E9_9ACTN|nr:Dienelactone hydrolase [Micromonospora narathiwatensis]